jgi:acyl-coenzyme A thioesterase PaaI-like protein
MKSADDEVLRFPVDAGCFGCAASNEAGLRMTFRRRGDRILSRYTIADRFHGAPGVAHGGIVATIFDEVSCAAVYFLGGTAVVTGELSVRYEKPCPVEREIEVQAWIADASHAKYAVVESQAHEGDTLLARATGRFFYSPLAGPRP